MEQEQKHILSQLTDHFSENIPLSENPELYDWVHASEENQATYHIYKRLWTTSGDIGNAQRFNTEKAWMKVDRKLSATTIRKNKFRSFLFAAGGAAAAVLILLGIHLVFLADRNNTATNPMVVETPPGQKTKLYLPDGTEVWLNSGSQLTYYPDYNIRNRHVDFQGEAFFDVAKNVDLAFNVLMDKINIEVLGTSFNVSANVSAYEKDDFVTVSLLEGHVAIRDMDGRLLTELLPNQKVKIDKNTVQYEVFPCDADADGVWRYGQLKIKEETLPEVVHKMERWYGVHIQLSGEIPVEGYIMTIKTESLTELLELINKITPINYHINGEEVSIHCK